MTSPPRHDPNRTRETHVYLTEPDHTALKKRAKAESRSVNGQILHYIKRGLENDKQDRVREKATAVD